ncbi:hypothetical protein F2Q68_00010527 [Brassica cretica]|uniref:Uncharacterized protein n=1 Tax=Brassica cretica TaxID=69181 RepID=A0A8S9L0H3_BRACR|nr:hypothetical protein F2Q68_00010527 [Brassica cretica]
MFDVSLRTRAGYILVQTSYERLSSFINHGCISSRRKDKVSTTRLLIEIRSDLEISDDFEAFWRYLGQAPEMTIELDHRSILKEEYRSMFTLEHRSIVKRAESPFGTCPAVLEVTRKLNYCSHQILQALSVQSAKKHAPHRSTIDNTTCSSIDNTTYRTGVDRRRSSNIDPRISIQIDRPTESTASCIAVRILTHKEFAARHPHPPSPVYVKIDRHSDTPIDRQHDTAIDRQHETAINRQPPAPIDRRTPLTYRVQMPKIDVSRLNALRPKPKPSNTHQRQSGYLQMMHKILWK